MNAATSSSQSMMIRDVGFGAFLSLLVWFVFVINAPHSLGGTAEELDVQSFAGANQLDRAMKLTMLIGGGLIVALRMRLAWAVVSANPGIAAFLAVAGASVAWSISPADTVLRLVSLYAIMLACLAFGLASWHPRRFQQTLYVPLMIILIGTLALGSVAPRLVIEQSDTLALKNAWHGLTHSKNELGMVSGVTLILCVNAAFGYWRTRWLAIGGALVALSCLLLSRSNTSTFAALLGIGLMWALMRWRRLQGPAARWYVIGLVSLIAIYGLAMQGFIPGLNLLFSPVALLTGKDSTFSARTTIWQVIRQHIAYSPILGTGYGAYWIGPLPQSPSYIFLALMYIYPTESHNGYLEVVNDLGLVGLACVALFVIRYLGQSLELLRFDRPQAALYIALMIDALVMNLQESDWFSRSNTCAVLVLAAVCLSRELIDARLLDRPPERSSELRRT